MNIRRNTCKYLSPLLGLLIVALTTNQATAQASKEPKKWEWSAKANPDDRRSFEESLEVYDSSQTLLARQVSAAYTTAELSLRIAKAWDEKAKAEPAGSETSLQYGNFASKAASFCSIACAKGTKLIAEEKSKQRYQDESLRTLMLSFEPDFKRLEDQATAFEPSDLAKRELQRKELESEDSRRRTQEQLKQLETDRKKLQDDVNRLGDQLEKDKHDANKQIRVVAQVVTRLIRQIGELNQKEQELRADLIRVSAYLDGLESLQETVRKHEVRIQQLEAKLDGIFTPPPPMFEQPPEYCHPQYCPPQYFHPQSCCRPIARFGLFRCR